MNRLVEFGPLVSPLLSKPVVKPIYQLLHRLPILLDGKLMPKKNDEDGKKKKKKVVKMPSQRKKDESPLQPVNWADLPQKPEPNQIQVTRIAKRNIMKIVFHTYIKGEQCILE